MRRGNTRALRAGESRDQIRFGDDRGRHEEVGYAQCDPPGQPETSELGVDDALSAATG